MPDSRIVAITRERALHPTLQASEPWVVLDVGANHAPYRSFVQATEYLTLDIQPPLINPAITSLPARRLSAPCGFLVRAVP